jgi:CheY-like chemotaxis protein
MGLESLLLSQDPELVRVIRPTLEKLSIDVEICHEARAGADILITDKFDAVIVDCDDLNGGLAVLQGLRSTPSNELCCFCHPQRQADDDARCFQHGGELFCRTDQVAQRVPLSCGPEFQYERRRYFRQPVKMLVVSY